ncbi:hypothetical protein GUITHDRAFT_136527 [Guillardia theta CCMP2712]|uniref:Protein kinase domain-containing protein n=1 Tax=Guillardia theta (strain CCMP2712) TaxID=905079 RepID=L1JK47_GUITC|nr:hypothetical protein GUITHDRAFT_136527 [Guillardia theta CCMP2712]EKX48893.1 hypothetical protein GUITHDRAFT_136527 [Guillardia theta CCMP2712]|eukprot:XP_005835873.1 hypothetical protein GUITHDRAFT_136527 [Guillardia theta CCMP2712]
MLKAESMEDYSLHDPMRTFAKCRSGSWVVRKEEFSLNRKIAEGAMGSIFMAILRGQTVAAKMLKKSETAGMQAYRDLITELDILISIGKHPNIVEFIGACIDDPQSPIAYKLPRNTIIGWILDMMRGLNFLHDRDPIIIHRDMKPGNLLLKADLSSLKLADFGMGKVVNQAMINSIVHTGHTGAVRYMAPEVYHVAKGHYTEKADIFSAAMIMWYIATGQRPNQGQGHNVEWRPDLNMVDWVELRPIIAQAWSAQPQMRPSALACARWRQRASARRQCAHGKLHVYHDVKRG